MADDRGSEQDLPPGGEHSAGDVPLSLRLLEAGVRGARSVGKAAGVERAIEAAAEEAMVATVESEAVERALKRVLNGPVVEEAVHGALESDAVRRALIDALDSEMVDEVWRRMLASDEAQRLVERIAEAPEIRAAISAQSVGFIEDIGHTIGDTTRRLDSVIERVARRLTLRKRRLEPTERAGALTRALAFGLDLLIVNLAFSGLAAIAALIGSFFSGAGNGLSGPALAVGGALWIGLAALYMVVFWSLAGQTPGMRFFGIRLGTDGRGLPPRKSLRRLAGLFLAAIPFGLGFLGVLFDRRRRGWQDRLAGVDVLYEGREPIVAPWSRLDTPEPLGVAPPGTTKAPDSQGLRPREVPGSPLRG
jgi:uncharacterized RDD family membrane protein YckC